MRPVLAQRADQRRTLASTTIPVVSVTAGSPAHDDGAWATLIASTAVEATQLDLGFDSVGQNGIDTAGLMDIAIGPSGSPTILVEDLAMGYLLGGNAPLRVSIPLRIPAGSEIIARWRCATASRVASMFADVIGVTPGVREVPSFDVCRTYGADPAASRGTELTVPAGTHQKSDWTEIVASTADPIYALGVRYQGSWQPGFSATFLMLDVGVGGAGAESVLIPDLYFRTATSETIFEDWPAVFVSPLRSIIPAGQRLVARYQTSVVAQGIDVCLYGFS
jgi:hypothetical protein